VRLGQGKPSTFRSVNRHERMGDVALSSAWVALIVKRVVVAAAVAEHYYTSELNRETNHGR
jgi:hypothetical protein